MYFIVFPVHSSPIDSEETPAVQSWCHFQRWLKENCMVYLFFGCYVILLSVW